MEKLKQINEEFTNILNENEKNIEGLNNKLDQLFKDRANIESELTKVDNSKDPDNALKSVELKEKLRMTDNAITYITETIQKNDETPLISKEDYFKYQKQIKQEADKITKDLFNQLREPINQIKNIAKESKTVENYANDLVHTLLYDLVHMDPYNIKHEYNRSETGSYNTVERDYTPKDSANYFYQNAIEDNPIIKELIKQ